MRLYDSMSGAALLLSLVGQATSDDATPSHKGDKSAPPPAVVSKQADEAKPTASTAVASKYPAEEAEVRKLAEAFCQAYSSRDAPAVAALFTEDAEYVDEHGEIYHGRQKIAELLASVFAERPVCPLKVDIDSIRFISAGVAVEDGTTTMLDADGLPTHSVRYTSVHVKSNGKWLTASTRDNIAAPGSPSLTEQLGWLEGEWVDEADDSVVEFTCRPILNGKFLARDFTVKIAGKAELTGSQRIGRDPQTGQLKSWTFDSEGGYGDGIWYRDGENWVLKTTGVQSDGSNISVTSVYSYVNDHTMTWQAVNHEIDGVRVPDGEIFTLVRRPPAPSDKDPSVAGD